MFLDPVVKPRDDTVGNK
ncbi:palindromic element RPE4 domain-containing protein [Rickettsia sp. R2]|nr:palindromic element RPE4 domain-containing protein [Rickettsia parkeri]HJD54012.1 palindromic element RPE4 domain-containing protein [Rickettsia endosymbiont of Proechinophthirus fluctus]